MSDFNARLEQQLLAAAERQAAALTAAPARRLHLAPRALALWAAGVVAVGAPALAATGLWNPSLGDGNHQGPTSGASAVPAGQSGRFAVLRREQTDADRGRAKTALSALTPGVSGVRTDAIRALTSTLTPGAVVLVPVERYAIPDGAEPAHVTTTPLSDGLCLFVDDRPQGTPDGGGWSCFSTAQALAGQATIGVGRVILGLVPDAASSVRITAGNTTVDTVSVTDNLYAFAAPQPTAATTTLTIQWLADDGAVINTTTRPAVPVTGKANVVCDPGVPAEQCDQIKKHAGASSAP